MAGPAALTNFDYASLPLPTIDSIRLLSVKNDPITKTVELSLVAFTLSAVPPYDAVSYVWGSNSRTRCLRLSNNDALWITENLELTLEYVIPRCSTGFLWIGQLCMLLVSQIKRVAAYSYRYQPEQHTREEPPGPPNGQDLLFGI
jgi:hypothetical protein